MTDQNTKNINTGDPKQRTRGFTLIEALVLLAVFTIIGVSTYEAFTLGMIHIANSKQRLIAIGVANEKMEVLRSLSYTNVAVDGGVPDGTIDPDEYVSVSGRQFHVLTSVSYRDDPDDGTLAAGTDDTPNDYKEALVRVYWGDETASEMVSLSSRFVPSGLETDSGGGILSVNVIDSVGAAVSNADVRIQNSTVSPAVDTTLVTGSDGNVKLIGAPASTQKYQITVSNDGSETVVTFPPYPTTAYYPNDVHMTAVSDFFTTSTIISPPLSDILIRVNDPLGVPVPDVNFDLEGGRVLGVTPLLEAVYNYSDSLETNPGGGNKDIEDVSPGTYYFTLDEPGYQLWKIDYGGDNERDDIGLEQGVSLTAPVIVMDEDLPSYFVRVMDNDTGMPVEDATVRLENTGLAYDVDEETDRYGYAYFPRQVGDALLDGTPYDVTVTADGYDEENGSVNINGLTDETIEVTPN